MRRRRTTSRHQELFVTSHRHNVNGYVTNLVRDGDVDIPIRYFVTNPNTRVVPGEIITDCRTSERFLLGKNSYRGSEVQFRAIPVTEELRWERMVETIDPVTKMARGTAPQLKGTILTTLDSIRPEHDAFRIPNARFTFFTNMPVEAGDLVDGMKVESVTNVIGLKLIVVT